ncbi:hypothetical protein AB0942_35780 [Streptomyces nodosus]
MRVRLGFEQGDDVVGEAVEGNGTRVGRGVDAPASLRTVICAVEAAR